jgi:peptidyl-prolyl cis-trans isomerase D
MLQNIRNNTQGLVAKFIIGLIIIPFALFGIDSLVGGNGPAIVATVNGEDVSARDLDLAMQLERRRLVNAMGEDADPALLGDDRLKGPALDRLIQQKLMLQAASSASMEVSAEAIDQVIVNMSQFQVDGQFTPSIYQNVLRSNGYTPAYFKTLMSNDMSISQINSGIASSDFITVRELEDIAKIIGQQRSFSYFLVPREKVAEQVTISESDIQQYYDANISEFQTQDLVKLEYIELKQQDFFKPVSAQVLQEAYEADMDSFASGEERRVSHILVEVNDARNDDEAKRLIEKLAAKLDQGEVFAEVADSFSDDRGSAQSAGDLGYTQGDTFPPAFEEALSSLALGQVSKPVQTDAGYHLIKATEIKQQDKPSFADREEVLKQRIQLAAAESDFVRAVEDLRDLVFNSEGLSGPASELNFTLKSSEMMGRNASNSLLANPQVIAAAFSSDVLEEGNNSEVIELASDHFIVVSVSERQVPRAKSLADVSPLINSRLAQQQLTELSLALAAQANSQLALGQSIGSIAEAGGYKVEVAENVTRNSVMVERSLLFSVFELPKLSAGVPLNDSVTLINGDVAVVQLNSVEDGSWSQFSEGEQRSLKSQLEQNFASGSLSGFLNSLRDSAEITVL